MRLALTLALFLVNTWAIASVLGARAPVSTRIGWSLAIAALPLAGLLLWWRLGPRRPRTLMANP